MRQFLLAGVLVLLGADLKARADIEHQYSSFQAELARDKDEALCGDIKREVLKLAPNSGADRMSCDELEKAFGARL